MQELDIICQAARGAGDIMRNADRSMALIEQKDGHANFVTEYDGKVQAYLIETLSRAFPDAHFVGEENGQAVFLPEYEAGLTFVIDPIDGTSNFMSGLFPFVTSIGLLKDGKPYIGVIYNPLSDQMFSARVGEGAYENGVRLEPCHKPLSRSLVMMGTAPYYPEWSDKCFEMAAKILPKCIDIRRSGSAAWDLCMTASGRVGMYFEPILQLYDYAAGAIIASEAGCSVTQLHGEPLTFRGSGSILSMTAGVTPEKLTKGSDPFVNFLTPMA